MRASSSGWRRPVEADIRPNPMDIGLLGPYAVVQVADALAQLFENLGRAQGRQRSVTAFQELLVLLLYTTYAPAKAEGKTRSPRPDVACYGAAPMLRSRTVARKQSLGNDAVGLV
jgi:hypothetical protein